MKTIKFRIWCPETKTMNYDPFADAYYESEHGCLLNEFFKKPGLVFLQFTGLRDSTGKEIWEGDICVAETGVIGTIEFYNGAFCWTDGACHWFITPTSRADHQPLESNCAVDNLEVVGNKYDNPTLLTGGK